MPATGNDNNKIITNHPPPPPIPSDPPPSATSPTLKADRRSSFGFLRRQKSSDGARNMLSKKSKGYQYPPPQSVPRVPPQLPQPAALPNTESFIGENHRVQYGTAVEYAATPPALHSSSSPPSYGAPAPPRPMTSHEELIDPYARTESMTHRGRYSYASSAFSVSGINSPRRVRRRKDPTPFK